MPAVLVVLLASSLLASCSGENQGASGAPPSAESSGAGASELEPSRVRLDVGHCYVEPVTFAGERWGLRFSEQFGWGGPQEYPENWKGAGVLTRVAEDRVRYTDDGGAELTLLPADSPAVARAEAVPCR